MTNLNKTEKAVTGLLVAVLLFFIIKIVQWITNKET